MTISLEEILHKLHAMKRTDEYEMAVFMEHADPIKLAQEGLRYLNGEGVKQDVIKFLYYLEASAVKGNIEAFFILGKAYIFGPIKTDLNLAISNFKLAVEKGHKQAPLFLGHIYYRVESSKDYSQAFKYFTIAAQHGDEFAINYLGVMYLKGLYVAQDLKKAQELFEIAHRSGLPVAINNLGTIHEKSNPSLAFKLYQEAAAKGCVYGNYNLSRSYKEGIGTEKDLEKSKKYRSIAAAQGHIDAKNECLQDLMEEEENERAAAALQTLQKCKDKNSDKILFSRKRKKTNGLDQPKKPSKLPKVKDSNFNILLEAVKSFQPEEQSEEQGIDLSAGAKSFSVKI